MTNVMRFKRDFPQYKTLTTKQVILIFKMYIVNTKRTYEVSSISFLVSGTLIILITSLFLNAGALMSISDQDKKPN